MTEPSPLNRRVFRMMTRRELVEYGLRGERQRKRAAAELFRRETEKLVRAGVLEIASARPGLRHVVARPREADGKPSSVSGPGGVGSLLDG